MSRSKRESEAVFYDPRTNRMHVPDWFYQNAACTDGQTQFTVSYFVTRYESNDIIRICLRDRQGRYTDVKTKDFFQRFKPMELEDLAPWTPPKPVRQPEIIDLT